MVDINTIDGFQGREKDIILFSCVRWVAVGEEEKVQQGGEEEEKNLRFLISPIPFIPQTPHIASNPCRSKVKGRSQGIGFVADERRINVGLTRARCSLIVIGNSKSLMVRRWD